jgi:Xaa-Pro dipeptidase
MKVGDADSEDHALAKKLIDIQDRALAEVAPGVAAAVPDRIYREGILSSGYEKKYTNKTFYSVGLLLHPSGGEPLEAAPGCTWKFETGMTFHTYLLARGFGFSETICITDNGYERLTNYPRELIVT